MPFRSVYASGTRFWGIHVGMPRLAPTCPGMFGGIHAGMPLGTPMSRLSKCGGLLTGPVRWTQSVPAMWNDGIHHFVEGGPGNVLQGLIRKVVPEADLVSG